MLRIRIWRSAERRLLREPDVPKHQWYSKAPVVEKSETRGKPKGGEREKASDFGQILDHFGKDLANKHYKNFRPPEFGLCAFGWLEVSSLSSRARRSGPPRTPTSGGRCPRRTRPLDPRSPSGPRFGHTPLYRNQGLGFLIVCGFELAETCPVTNGHGSRDSWQSRWVSRLTSIFLFPDVKMCYPEQCFLLLFSRSKKFRLRRFIFFI